MKLTVAKKRLIAVSYVAGKSIAAICQEHGISEAALYRLKREDKAFLDAVQELTKEARAHLSRLLEQHVGAALQVLKNTLDLNVNNFTEETGPNGGKVVTRRIDPKLVSERRLAADCLLSHWQRLSERHQTQRNWEQLNFGTNDEDDDDFDDDDTSNLLERARSLGGH